MGVLVVLLSRPAMLIMPTVEEEDDEEASCSLERFRRFDPFSAGWRGTLELIFLEATAKVVGKRRCVFWVS